MPARARARATPGRDAAGADAETLLRAAARALRGRAGDATSARLEAEVLLGAVLGRSRAALLALGTVEEPDARAFEALVRARADDGVPVAYLTGRRAFLDLELHVDRRVLVPRPETELLVEVLLEALDAATDPLPGGWVADVGTGSGCVALAVARRRPVLAIDTSADALEVAAHNRAACAPAQRVALVRGDLLGALAPGRLAAIVANPPYVEPDTLPTLADDVREHEPRDALVPRGESTSSLYARLVAQAAHALRPGGLFATEVGAGQAGAVATRLAGPAWRDAGTRRDLAGHERVVHARRA